MSAPRGRANGRWNPGRILSSHGYVMVRVGIGHPLADARGYAYEHALVWTAAHGPVPEGFEVHHRNEQKDDNRLGNLQLRTKSAHAREHAAERRRARDGRFRREARR